MKSSFFSVNMTKNCLVVLLIFGCTVGAVQVPKVARVLEDPEVPEIPDIPEVSGVPKVPMKVSKFFLQNSVEHAIACKFAY